MTPLCIFLLVIAVIVAVMLIISACLNSTPSSCGPCSCSSSSDDFLSAALSIAVFESLFDDY